MYARHDGKRSPCVRCKRPTSFVIDYVGPRGAKHTDPMCPECGEQAVDLHRAAGAART